MMRAMNTHFSPHSASARLARGFTLIEIMIALAIVAILTAVAYPSYTSYVARAKRADARSTLLQAAQFMQRFYAANDQFEKDRGGNDAALPSNLQRSPSDGPQMYAISMTNPTATSYILTASPVVGSQMANDACGSFTLTNTGVRGVTNATKSRDDCWK